MTIRVRRRGDRITVLRLPVLLPVLRLPVLFGAVSMGITRPSSDDTYAVQPAYSYDAPVPDTSVNDSAARQHTYAAQNAQGYYAGWRPVGRGNEQYKLNMDQLVTYLKSYIVDA